MNSPENPRGYPAGKKGLLFWILLLAAANVLAIGIFLFIQLFRSDEVLKQEKEQMAALAGVNREITGEVYDEALAVSCDNGTFVGKEKNGVHSFKGIPYAEAPVGKLRWKPPVDKAEGDGVYEAFYFGKSGIQTETESERASLYLQGEDCLTLNIWTAAEGQEESGKRPVMVFFPGGGYGWGGTADPLYDGQYFIEAHPDVLLVTVNYRIGIMGFVDFSRVEGGEDYEESGNLGLLDQISALRWVRRNIAAFGGDPENVTIFGESAGGSSVSFLPLIDIAKGLFHRVIAQSGSLAFSFSKEECQTFTEMLLKEAKASSMKDLLALSEDDLKRINEKLNDYNNFPERDGIILPEDVYLAYAEGKASDVDMLSGTNADEARYWIQEVGGYPVYALAAPVLYQSVRKSLLEPDRRYADAFLELQTEDDPWDMTEFFNELFFRVPAVRQAELHAGTGGRHFMYYWTKESEIENYGACHAVELSYVFNNLEDTIYTGAPADKKLAEAVQEMWVSFAKTGDPSTDRWTWLPYDDADRVTMVLGDDIRMVPDPLEEQRVLTEPLLKYRLNGYYMMADYAFLYLRNRIIRAILIQAAVNALILLIIAIIRWKKLRKPVITERIYVAQKD
ncbi:MAG: carboxylesterase/lipase family protein [Lachnospiraceae bacterium]|nr:carboxylesterase/lipase family protein [Lachnospiraceae bacterium]